MSDQLTLGDVLPDDRKGEYSSDVLSLTLEEAMYYVKFQTTSGLSSDPNVQQEQINGINAILKDYQATGGTETGDSNAYWDKSYDESDAYWNKQSDVAYWNKQEANDPSGAYWNANG